MLYHDPESGIVTPRLSLFASVSDDDGLEDIASWELRDPTERIVWSAPTELLDVRSTDDGRVWVGSSAVSYPVGTEPVFGVHELIVRDLAGLSEQIRFEVFSLDYQEVVGLLQGIDPGELSAGDGIAADRLSFRIYDNTGTAVSDVADNFESAISAAGEGATGYIHAYLERSNIWIVSGPYRR